MPGTTINGSTQRAAARLQAADAGGRHPRAVPRAVEGPSLPAGKVYEQPVIQLDILPTALAAAGVERRAGLEARRRRPAAVPDRQAARAPPHEALYWRFGEQMAIRKGDWKLVKYDGGSVARCGHGQPATRGAQLYNLANDIGERHDLAAVHPEKVKELADDWLRWSRQMAKPLWGTGRRWKGTGRALAGR